MNKITSFSKNTRHQVHAAHAGIIPGRYEDARLDERRFRPAVSLSHQQVCQKAVSFISKDAELSKRDDVLVNLVINVCLPDVTEDNLLQLLQTLLDIDNHQASKLLTTDKPSGGILPEYGDEATGLGGIEVDSVTHNTLEQESVEGLHGNAGDEQDRPDGNNDHLWEFLFKETTLTASSLSETKKDILRVLVEDFLPD